MRSRTLVTGVGLCALRGGVVGALVVGAWAADAGLRNARNAPPSVTHTSNTAPAAIAATRSGGDAVGVVAIVSCETALGELSGLALSSTTAGGLTLGLGCG